MVQQLRAQASAGWARGARIEHISEFDAAVAWLENRASAPGWVAVLQNWPGEISDAQVAALRRAAPLARICGVLGSWCEGEARSGKPWPATQRCSSIAWPDRFARELAQAAVGAATPWSLPATLAPDEALLAAAGRASPQCATAQLRRRHVAGRQLSPTRLAIVSRSGESRRALAEAATARGFESVTLAGWGSASVVDVRAAIWDTDPEVVSDGEAARKVLALVGQAPLVALVGFPRAEDIARALAGGVRAVIAKPYLLDEVFRQLEAQTTA
jgi:CheY-like chemotaxis protein